MKDFFEKIEKELLENENRTKDLNCKIEDFDLNFLRKDDYLKEKSISFEKEGDTIDKKDFEEDIKEDNLVLNDILEDLNKNILINVKEEEEEEKNQKACQEILEILRYPKSDKNLRGVISPFKPLIQPKKISMVGKVFYNSAYYDENKTRENTMNINSNNNNIENKEH